MDNGRGLKTQSGEKEMVKYYFQSLNGTLSFVHAGTKEELEEKVKKEFGADKDEAKARIKKQIDDAEAKLKSLENLKFVNEKDKLENDIKVATLRKGIFDAKNEFERVDNLIKADLVFFELTPVDLNLG